ncbi:Undecaprenyl-phosphate mannosyltransferase [Pelotomaculum sp. FP]|uniref:glycosyltransferase family 2 protein n=1 Tax=Pelotomaculum sp. FP TaxID=261474 RepID=UPI001104402C|nr:glycosyltransferase family 2 protein [Pelotomaculum sp. FP]TEB16169.1 Undecaprenyl-phosphate mannosyltransferase [Pelotomaculum sp. FP]
MQLQVPKFEIKELAPKRTKYCLCIPVINEGKNIIQQLERFQRFNGNQLIDVILCDGGSTDGSTEEEWLMKLGVNTLLVKTGPGKLSAQLRMGYYWSLERGYEGIVTVDGNGKDSVESVPLFIQALDEGYDMIQGSRYIDGGQAINTPWIRHISVKLLHIPIISYAAGFRYTDTTNGFRGYSRRYLLHPEVQPFRDIFNTYELLAYLSVRAPRLGFKTKEIPVKRVYPPKGKIPTKISFFKGNTDLLRILFNVVCGKYNPNENTRD